jgi:hypothetical protein
MIIISLKMVFDDEVIDGKRLHAVTPTEVSKRHH